MTWPWLTSATATTIPTLWTAWWFIPLSKWVITPVISGLTPLIPFITRVITHLRFVGWATKWCSNPLNVKNGFAQVADSPPVPCKRKTELGPWGESVENLSRCAKKHRAEGLRPPFLSPGGMPRRKCSLKRVLRYYDSLKAALFFQKLTKKRMKDSGSDGYIWWRSEGD